MQLIRNLWEQFWVQRYLCTQESGSQSSQKAKHCILHNGTYHFKI